MNAFPRVVDAVREAGGDPGEGGIRYRIEGRVRRQDDRPALRVRVEAEFVLACQRCLGFLPVRVASERELVFVPQASLGDIADEEDEADFLPDHERLELSAAVEDEVLLSLPMVPVHDDVSCRPVVGTVETIGPIGLRLIDALDKH
ncbi:MAG: DUF177 domain-containing protein [Burkholderiales bacterium]|nr:DUF177 domain-containing protein [Burkholderiales bacterium]